MYTPENMTKNALWCAWMKSPGSLLANPALLFRPSRGNLNGTIQNTSAMGHALYSCLQPLLRNGGGAEVTERRTRIDWAHQIKKLVTVDFPDSEKIVLVMDNLDTHTMGSLYKAFSPEEAKRLRDRLEVHYTPKHGSWLNMAEIENNVLINHGLSKRIPTIEQMKNEVAAWTEARNRSAGKINWRFTTDDARIKLKRLYPQLE